MWPVESNQIDTIKIDAIVKFVNDAELAMALLFQWHKLTF